jgi:DNA-binding NarL/FixJ family response regulator
VAARKVLLVVAHPVIASGIETLLKLEGDYDIKRVPSVADASKTGEWRADVALIDGTLLLSYTEATIGVPSYVLSGSERDGRQLARKLDDARGWLRKDATGSELHDAITSLMRSGAKPDVSIGTLGIAAIVVLSLIVLALVAYLIWLAVY